MKYPYIAVSIISVILDCVLMVAVANGNIGRFLACILVMFISGIGVFCAYTAGEMEVYERVDKWMIPEETKRK